MKLRIFIKALLPALALTVLLSACSSPVTILGVGVSVDGTVLKLSLSACNANVTVDYSVDDEAVMILVQERGSFIGSGGDDDCADEYTIVLDEPLGDRVVIDEQTGQQLVPGG
ncbi:MAG: hypothetical protein QNJ75_02275 [Acidimicrobiia bacterium]|nr:hypothetical protein [Acidimicrobiia bacterium]